MSDWINRAVEKIHVEYPRVLRECNDQTPRPWLYAVIRDAAPRCDECRHWVKHPHLDDLGECERQFAAAAKMGTDASGGAGVLTEPDFGCTQWEAK